jgi:hypothetical protein
LDTGFLEEILHGTGNSEKVTVHGLRVTAVQTGIGRGRARGFARLSPRRGRRFNGGGIGHGPSPRLGRAGETFSSSCFRPQSDLYYRQ